MRNFIFKLLVYILLFLFSVPLAAQNSWVMVDDSTLAIGCDTSLTGVIYDDGGPTGNYSSSFYGTVNLYFGPGDTLLLWGSVDCEPQYDYLGIFDGQSWHYYYSNDTVSLTCITSPVSVYFSSDGSVVDGGFELHYELRPTHCNNGIGELWGYAPDLTMTTLYWDAVNPSGPFVLNVNGHDTTLNQNFCSLTNLSRGTTYGCYVYGVADSGSPDCRRYYSFSTPECLIPITSISTTWVSPTSITVAWTSDGPGPYRISDGSNSYVATSRQYTFTGLTPNTPYSFTVLAEADTCCASCGRTLATRSACFEARVEGLRPLIGADTVTLVADSADGYLWSTGETTRSIAVSHPGYYTLVAYTDGGCTDTLTVGVSNIELDIDIDLPDYLCPGESTSVYVGLRPDANVQVSCNSNSTLSDPSRIFLPDGVDCDPASDHGCSYRSELDFEGFGNYQLITDVNDILYVMLDMEHSYVGDIYINITCPNGQNADILRFSGSGYSSCTSHIGMEHRGWAEGNNCQHCYFGQPYDFEDNSFPCDSTRSGNVAGTGWRYCWSNSSDAGYTYAAGDGIIYRSDNLVSYGSSFDSSNVAAGTNFYHPDQSLQSLVGCPMNGTWYIEVIDGWGVDNGYIFGWELALNPNRLARTLYEPSVAYAALNGQYVARTSDSTFTITAPANLASDTTITYTVHIYDTAGNLFDTSFSITFHPRFTRTFNDTIVENQLPYTIYDTTFTGPVSNVVLYRPNDGTCDSIITYSLHVIPNGFSIHDTTVCDDQLPLVWHGLTFATAGTQRDTVLTPQGADSVLTLNLHVNPSYSQSFYDTICSNQTRTFEGTDYALTGTYSHTYTTIGGCDSVRTLWLTVHPTSQTDTVVDVCDQFAIGGITYTTPGTSSIMLSNYGTNVYGCDSSLMLHLTLRQSSDSNLYVSACDSFYWHGQMLTSEPDSVLTYLTTNSVGCDSTVRLLSLSLHYTQYIGDSDTVCASSVTAGYRWRDTLIAAPATGNYAYVRSDSQGCDSNYSLSLTLVPTAYRNIYDTIVENQAATWSYHGIPLNHDTVLVLTLTGSTGCDSIVTYHLHVWPNVTHTFDSTICVNQWGSFLWHGLAAADTLSVTLPDQHGADSMVTLFLHTLPSYSIALYDTICSNHPVTFEGNTYAATGTYQAHLHTSSVLQCDSIRTLYLTVFDTTVGDTMATACDSFSWYGNHYVASTTDALVGHYLNTASCDSTVVLHLTVNHSTTATYNDTCPENYLPRQYIHIISYGDTSGAVMTIPNAAGCDSVITYSLHVWRNVYDTLDSTICASLLPTFSWNGQTSSLSPVSGTQPGQVLPTLADTLHATIPTVHGADSIITMRLHVNPVYAHDFYDTICDNQSSRFVDIDYSDSGEYSHTLVSQNLCDSVVTFHLAVNPTSSTDFYDTIYLGESVTFEGQIYNEPGDYTVTYSNRLGCDSSLVLHLTGKNIITLSIGDSICQGDSLWFISRYVNETGIYLDTIFTGDFYRGDTAVQLDLRVVAPPTISIDTSHLCDPTPLFVLEGQAEVPYLQWSSLPYDGGIEDHEHDSIINVSPSDSTWYYLYADYRPDPLCPAVDSILLPPLSSVTPVIELVPQYITMDNRTLKAYDRSVGPATRHLWYVWYDGVQAFTTTDAVLSLDVPPSVDSIQITLQVYTHTCSFVTTVDVPIRRSGILFPNVFTPTQNLNNRFAAVGKGVLEFEIWIYDRRGDIVYHSTDIREGWDGTHDGTPCQQGSYVYFCRYTDQLIPQGYQTAKGTVTLIR